MEYLSKLKLSDLFALSSIQSPLSPPSASSSPTNSAMAAEPKSGESSQFGSALETMDRFLETNESNLLVQSFVSLESKTNISRRYLARGALFIIAGYFLFSNSVLDLITHLLMYLYPSYRSYLLLNKCEITKEDLTVILKYWIFIGLFSTADLLLGFLIPFGSVIKLIFIIQCALPRQSPMVDFAISHFVSPVFRYLEQNENIAQVNSYLGSLSNSLEQSKAHQE